METLHVVVAVGLGQDGSRRYGYVFAVALHHRDVRRVAIGREAVAVDEQMLRTHAQSVDGAVHGQDGGAQDVYLVNLGGRHHAHGPGHGLALDDLAQGVAPVLAELLGVVEQLVAEVRRQDDGCGIDRPGQTSSPGLVASGLNHAFV